MSLKIRKKKGIVALPFPTVARIGCYECMQQLLEILATGTKIYKKVMFKKKFLEW